MHNILRPAALAPLALALFAAAPLPVQAQSSLKLGEVELDASLTLDGIFARRYSGKEGTPAGFGHAHGDEDHGHHHGHSHALENGFNAGHSEIGLRARTDLFDGVLTIGFDDEDVKVEEAYLVTRALPAGLRVKAGKFLSDIGYVNSRHPHDWSFVERPLVNQYLFGDHGLLERGVQLSYTLPTRSFAMLGVEVLQGNGEGMDRYDDGALSARKSGPRLLTAFAKFGPDLGDRHALQAGVSGGTSRQNVRVDAHGDHTHYIDGDAWFAGADLMYRYDAGRSHGEGNWRIGGEYYYVERDVGAGGGNRARWLNYTEKQDGAYIEAVYGFAPRWEAGVRAEALGLNNKVVKFHPRALGEEDSSYRYSAQVTWRARETVFVRAQLTREDFAGQRAHGSEAAVAQDGSWMFMLQLNALFGSHPAHRF
ncbi:MAG TPA: TonB-dependent receptor [Thauera sp.]|nr:TonB-dependent receptor [Thauera sp.]HNS94224.1 TonB-dependent receptor [Thauera sp.]